MNTRERMFFGVSDITAWKFAGVNILHILYILSNRQQKIYGRAIQQLFAELFGGTWVVGNDLLYTILNTYELEGYVASQWDRDESDPNKKYIRRYWITTKGVNYYKSLKWTFISTLKHMESIFDTSLEFVWGDRKPQEPATNAVQISSSAFTVLNILNLLNKKSAENNPESGWLYGREIKQELKRIYRGLWEPSDGVLYPQLSELCADGFVVDKWEQNDDEASLKKKRTVRKYMITEKGREYFARLASPESGLKNKIIGLQKMCRRSLDFLDNKIPPQVVYKKASA